MEQFDYLIIGAGIAGTNAAETIRHHDLSGTIALFTDEDERLYSRVLLPQYLRGTIPEERVFLKKPSFYEETQISFKPKSAVHRVDTRQKLIETGSGVQFGYQKLLLATGARLNPWSVPGEGLEGVVYLRTLAQTRQLRQLVANAQEAVVIGGGFIALELVLSFLSHGLKTTLLVIEPYFFSKFLSEEAGQLVATILKNHGVSIITGEETAKIEGTNQVSTLVTKSGQKLNAQLVGVGVGVSPELSYLAGTGLEKERFITTNEYLETEVDGVWAAGDVTYFLDLASGRSHNLGNWANAADQGRIAGANMAGEKTPFRATSSYSISFFESSIAIIGDPSQKYADQVVKRGNGASGALGEIYFKHDQIIGAVLVGLPQDRGSIQNLIKNKTIMKDKSQIEDVSFDLGALLHE